MAGKISNKLLDWYDRHARDLPWRVPPAKSKAGQRMDPYRVWLSEVMLQQTQVVTVKEYYARFLERWHSVTLLAKAEREEVMQAWAGLGYYSRARNLKACAETVTNDYSGKFPDTKTELIKLPGIGDYTASAIAAIAFNRPEAVLDGNVERVFSRLHEIATPIPEAKQELRALVALALDPERPGDFAQACMDLGATLCTPKNPACSLCPLNRECLAYKSGKVEGFPVKLPKKIKPTRKGAAFVAITPNNQIYLVEREAKGLLGGMTAVPSSGWTASRDGETGTEAAPFPAEWTNVGIVKHTFTHFHLLLDVWYSSNIAAESNVQGRWIALEELPEQALPSLFKKVIERAVPGATKK